MYGMNIFGQLGLGDFKDRNRPTLLQFNHDILIVILYLRQRTVYMFVVVTWKDNWVSVTSPIEILNTSNGIYVCDSNHNGKLGLGDREGRCSLTKLCFNHEIVSVHCEAEHY